MVAKITSKPKNNQPIYHPILRKNLPFHSTLKMLFNHTFLLLVLTYIVRPYIVHGLTIEQQFPQWNRSIIRADPSIIIQSNEPDLSFPPNSEFKSQHPDILRGSLSYFSTQTNINRTLLVLDIPQSARAKWCSFHLSFEQEDIIWPLQLVELWSLETLPVEFETTWNTRPNRKHWLGTIQTFASVTIYQYTTFSSFNLNPFSVPFHIPRPDVEAQRDQQVFPCQLFLGKTGFELAALPTHHDGFRPWAWKSPGLMVEVFDEPWTYIPQYNFTISPLSNSTFMSSSEFMVDSTTDTNFYWGNLYSGYKWKVIESANSSNSLVN